MKRQSNYSVEEIQQMLNKATHCLNCGKKLNHINCKDSRNRGFCSNICYLEKPVKMIYAEKEYKKPIKEIILEMLNEGITVTATAERLGIGKPQFYEWMKRLDIKKKVVWG